VAQVGGKFLVPNDPEVWAAGPARPCARGPGFAESGALEFKSANEEAVSETPEADGGTTTNSCIVDGRNERFSPLFVKKPMQNPNISVDVANNIAATEGSRTVDGCVESIL